MADEPPSELPASDRGAAGPAATAMEARRTAAPAKESSFRCVIGELGRGPG